MSLTTCSRRVADAVLKRQRPARIVTHDGAFHCDEALACFLLTKTKVFRNYEIVRTRDPAIIRSETSDVVVDVGGIFDSVQLRFDHHQRGFDDCFGFGFKTKLSSAGLVYREFGKEIIADECNISEDSNECKTLWIAVYKNFMEAIDAIDNGVNQYDFETLLKGTDQDSNPKPLFINNSGLSSRVGQLNTPWNDPANNDSEKLTAKQKEQFYKAMRMVGDEFLDSIQYHKNVWMPARSIVVSALEGRFDFHASGRVILLETRCNWKVRYCTCIYTFFLSLWHSHSDSHNWSAFRSDLTYCIDTPNLSCSIFLICVRRLTMKNEYSSPLI